MGWFGFSRPAAESAPEILNVPLFPLNTVLFPGGILPLKIFEQRYLDMAARCMKEGSPFGVCLIASGDEAGKPAEPHPVGTLARITSWDMEQLGILMITTQGERRFRIRDSQHRDNLLEGEVELLEEGHPAMFPPERDRLIPLLRKIVTDMGAERIPEPHHFGNAEWVGYRITEILPIQNLAKQKLLELDDPLMRLEILEKYLDQRKLLG